MVHKITEVKAVTVKRIPTGIDELDYMYGYCEFTGECAWGLPAGKMSLWAGEKGTGKSRAAIEVCRTIARRVYDYPGMEKFKYNVLYFQREVDLGTLAGWVKQDGGIMPDNFYVSRSNTVVDQVKDIIRIRPMLVIVDSINMVKDFRGNSEEKIELAIEGGNGVPCYRDVCNTIGCHIIFLNQLTKSGVARGSSVIAHLLDVEMILKRNGPDGFSMACPQKNRYGKTGLVSWWIHNRQKAQIESSFRLEDEDWCRTHGLKRRDIKAEGKVFQRQMAREVRQENRQSQQQEIDDAEKAFQDSLTFKQKFGRWFCGIT